MTLKEVLFLYHTWRRTMKIRKWLQAIQWGNVGLGAVQLLFSLPPPLNANPKVLLAQAVLSAFLPGLAGLDHRFAGTEVVPKAVKA